MTKKSKQRLEKLLEKRKKINGQNRTKGRMKVHTHAWFNRQKRLKKIADASRRRNRK